MKILGRIPPCFFPLVAVAVASLSILTLAGCTETAPPVEKPKPPVGVSVEVQVFSMPRALAVEAVLGQPTGADYAAILKSVLGFVGEKKATLVATPTVNTLSGQRAMVESVLEHKYPTEYSPPQIPQTTGASEPVRKVTKTTIITQETTSFPNTPSTPTAFEKRDLGISMEIEPTVDERLQEIVIQASLQHVALQGTAKFKTETNSEIEQPEFYMKKIVTIVHVKSGGVALLGTIEPDRTLTKGEDLTEVIFIRATIR